MNGPNRHPLPLDPAALGGRLRTAPGPEYWRSLEELAGSREFAEFVQREFPQQAAEWHDPVSRRRFLQLMGASLALAGLGACSSQPEEKIVPYVRAPEASLLPYRPLYFSTALTL